MSGPGPSAAVPDLFLGRPWVITDSGLVGPDAVLAVRSLAVDLGAVPVTMDADAHDAAVAAVSHVPQVAASLVAARLRGADDAALGLAGQGLRDVTRIAASDPALWTSILAANAGAVRDVLRELRADLDTVIDALATPPPPTGPRPSARACWPRRACDRRRERGRRADPREARRRAPRVRRVTVLVPTHRRAARLLTDVGEAGVNLEDLHLEHAAGRPVGMAEISVLPGGSSTSRRS